LSLGTALIRPDLTIQIPYYMALPSVSNLHKLQMVQNALARTITRSPCSVSTSQLLSNLDWLPIHKQINFKVAILFLTVSSRFAKTRFAGKIAFRIFNRDFPGGN